MDKKRFTLNFEGTGITAKGGYLKEISGHPVRPGFQISGNELHIHLTEEFTKKEFNRSVTTLVKGRSYLSFIKLKFISRLDAIMAFILSLSLVLLIILISIHGSLTYDLISGNDNTTILNFPGTWIFVIISLIILSMLYFFPKVIFGDYDNVLKGMLSAFSSGTRQKNRFRHQVNICLQTNRGVDRLILWNPLVQGKQGWIMQQLLPVLLSMNEKMVLQIKTDEKIFFIDLFKENGIRLATVDYQGMERGDMVFPPQYLTSWEKQYLSFLAFCSTLNLPDHWGNGNRTEHFVSWELAEVLFNNYKESIFNFTDDTIAIDRFIQRCIFDYCYLSENEKKDLILHPSLDASWLSGSQVEMLRDHTTSVISSVSPGLKESLSYLILLGLLQEMDAFHPKKLQLLSLFIQATLESEGYHLMSDYWNDVSFIPEEDKEDKGYRFSLLQFFDIDTLQALSECLQNSGMYEKALEIYGFTGNIYPARAAIDRSAIIESLGKYREALAVLYETESKWIKSGIVNGENISLELYWNAAWVIVSGRLEDEKKNGYTFLEKMDGILNKLPDAGQYILYLARYYNTRANYEEWEERYKDAIESYEKALSLPGQYLQKSSLLVNMGISQRLLGHQKTGNREKTAMYRQSLDNIRKGVEMKIAIGEKNQIPSSRHNLAETALELAYVTEDETKRKEILTEAHENACLGLSMLKEIKSTKKMGRLLVERYLSEFLLNQLGEPADPGISEKELKEWMSEQDKESFDHREVSEMLRRFDREEIC